MYNDLFYLIVLNNRHASVNYLSIYPNKKHNYMLHIFIF